MVHPPGNIDPVARLTWHLTKGASKTFACNGGSWRYWPVIDVLDLVCIIDHILIICVTNALWWCVKFWNSRLCFNATISPFCATYYQSQCTVIHVPMVLISTWMVLISDLKPDVLTSHVFKVQICRRILVQADCDLKQSHVKTRRDEMMGLSHSVTWYPTPIPDWRGVLCCV